MAAPPPTLGPRLIAAPPPNEPLPLLKPAPPPPPPPPPWPRICTCSNSAPLSSDMSARIGAAPAEPVQRALAAIMAEARSIARPVIVLLHRCFQFSLSIFMSCATERPPPRLHGDQRGTTGCVPDFDSPRKRLDQDRAMEQGAEWNTATK